MMAMRRPAGVMGIFDPTSLETLTGEVARFLLLWQEPKSVKAVVSSHAGIGYSGKVAPGQYAAHSVSAVNSGRLPRRWYAT
jgi:AmmeMemoRadiSam system protein B